MQYLKGYTIKPFAVSTLGDVIFTDGTNNNISANQVQCQAYGYTYDRATGTCSAFKYNANLTRNVEDINNKFNGVGNSTQLGSNTIQINGTNNTTEGFNNNCFISGINNTIANGINNATVVGTLAEATATNSIVLGGNSDGDALGTRQNITLMFGVQTTNNVATNTSLSNTTVGQRNFEIPLNSIITFQTETVAVRTGGSGGGSVGDFKAFIETGAAVCNSAGAITLDKSRTIIANVGTTSGWLSDVVVSGTSFVQQVNGANNRTIEWATTMRITQLKTGVTIP
tara:strand:+ start:3090 stop:3941 length:852 start_codon:yes stop_codon:yes gene_type:complete